MNRIKILLQLAGSLALLFSAVLEIFEDIYGELLGFEIHHALLLFAIGHIISVSNSIIDDLKLVNEHIRK